MIGAALSPCKPDWGFVSEEEQPWQCQRFIYDSLMLNLYWFQGARSGTLAMHHWRWKSGSYFPFSFTRASHQLLVPFLLPAQNPHISPLMSSASHISALLSLLHFSQKNLAPWNPSFVRGWTACTSKLRKALCWFPIHSVELPRLTSQYLQKCLSFLIVYVQMHFQKFSQEFLPKISVYLCPRCFGWT